MFDLLVALANDQSIMGRHSQEEQALMKIQHEWADARVKGDSSYTQRLEAEDCTVVWPDGKIVNKRADLQTMTGDIVFLNSRFTICKCVFMATQESWWVAASSKRIRESKIFSVENSYGPARL